jgi:arylsulfatase A-like enzyme
MSEKPNILLIMTDQHRADHVGFMGNPTVRTPNLDRLASSGCVFENAWVSNPVCMPNRATILTGRMPTAHGVIFNDRSLDWYANTFVRQLRADGYRTALLGKSHLQHGMSRNSVVDFRGQGALLDHQPQGWDRFEDYERYLDKPPKDPEDFYGFERIELSIDHGARVTGHHLQWALAQGAKREALLAPYDANAPGQKRSDEWWQVYEAPYDERFHSTRFVTERTQDFIQSCSENSEPWMAMCSFPDPHHPISPPAPWFDRHDAADMPLPQSRHDPLTHAPAHLRAFQRLHPADQRDWVAPCGYGNDRLLGQAIAATYGMIEMVDDGVGRILEQLDTLGLRDNTIVIFTSDHGDMMGDHGLFLKGFMHYRGTLQVPLVISAPNMSAQRVQGLASSIDIAPTILELCKLRSYDGIQGHSLKPMLSSEDVRVRDHVLIEDDIATITAKLTPIPAKTRTVITEQYRYTRNAKGEEQLFDLQADPDEMQDLTASNHPARGQMMEVLADALMAADDAARGAPTQDGHIPGLS